jgi:hypothetical protein
MSLTPGVTGTGPGSGGISDVVSQDDLTRWAQIAGVMRYLTAPLEPPPAPSSGYSGAPSVAASIFTNTFAALTSAGADIGPSYVNAVNEAARASNIGVYAAMLVELGSLIIYPFALAVFGLLDSVRKGIDPVVASLAVEVLNEFLGSDFTQQQLPLGLGSGDHLARAQQIGTLLYNQLESEFVAASGGTVVPSIAPAQTFSGLAINFGLASSIIGIAGGALEFLHLDELRELGEEVAKNIGLGRLVRRALTPLITTLVSNPAQWAINVKYRPTQFKEADLVNPYFSTTLPHDQLYNAMYLLGYSDDKIQAFIEMHEKKLTPADVQLLIDWGFWTTDDGTKYLQRQGWPAGFAGNVLQLEGFHEVRSWITKEVDVLLAEVASGQITVNELAQVIDGFAISPQEKNVIVALANYRGQKTHLHAPAKLSSGELYAAFAAGIVTSSDLTDRWTAQGLPAADQDIRLQLWLLHLNRLHELEQSKRTAFQEKVSKFQQEQAGAKKVLEPPIPPIPPFPLG